MLQQHGHALEAYLKVNVPVCVVFNRVQLKSYVSHIFLALKKLNHIKS